MRWKLGATAAINQCVLRTDPELALADTWVLCRQMRGFLDGKAGREALGEGRDAAETLAAELETRIETIARRALKSGDLARVSAFVDSFAATHPLKSLAFEREPASLEWRRAGAGNSRVTVGDMAEAISDLADRVSVFGQLIPMEVRWRIDLERAEFEPIAAELTCIHHTPEV
ncbi:MAG: hypothetical protein FJ399_03720 [Verrucomicrobia bacterium]|nr:hypothetical protein [Verrucomicrobiota bacterium]